MIPGTRPFLYQVQAVEAVRRLEYAALFHEQGLGKTKIGIDLALLWLKEGVANSVLIVTKRTLIKNWTDEIKAHMFFEARLFAQDKKANFFAFNSPARLYLTHYEVLKSEERRFALSRKRARLRSSSTKRHKRSRIPKPRSRRPFTSSPPGLSAASS